MEEKKCKSCGLVSVVIFIILLAGIYVSFAYGKAKGNEEGRSSLLLEQKATAEQKLLDQANPFTETEATNPFEGSYENPFEDTTTNPFAQ